MLLSRVWSDVQDSIKRKSVHDPRIERSTTLGGREFSFSDTISDLAEGIRRKFMTH